MSEKKIDLSIVIPCFKEGRRIESTLTSLFKYLDKKNFTFEVIIANAYSGDKTDKIVEKFISKRNDLIYWQNNKRMGKGHDVKHAMLKIAGGDYRLFMDADMSTPLKYIEEFYNQCRAGQDIVIASRYNQKNSIKDKQPITRRLISRIGNILIRIFLLPKIKDTQCGFKIFSKKATKEIFAKQTINGWNFDMEILTIATIKGYLIKEIPVEWSHKKSYAMTGSDNLSNSYKIALQSAADVRKIISNRKNGLY